MTLESAIGLGIIQGLTEFLPISSSAHLVLVPRFLHWSDPGLSFDVALHLGTLLAVGWYFRQDLLFLIKSLGKFLYFLIKTKDDRFLFLKQELLTLEQPVDITKDKMDLEKKWRVGWRLAVFLLLGTLPGAVAGYFFNDWAETVFRQPWFIGINLLIFGLLLYRADLSLKKKPTSSKLSWRQAFLIGLGQALALFPGVSRSGVTITIGLFLGLSRSAAARFSFLLSFPIILGAVLYKLPSLLSGEQYSHLLVAIGSAAFSGYLAITFLLKLVSQHGYTIFVWYRVILAILIFLIN